MTKILFVVYLTLFHTVCMKSSSVVVMRTVLENSGSIPILCFNSSDDGITNTARHKYFVTASIAIVEQSIYSNRMIIVTAHAIKYTTTGEKTASKIH